MTSPQQPDAKAAAAEAKLTADATVAAELKLSEATIAAAKIAADATTAAAKVTADALVSVATINAAAKAADDSRKSDFAKMLWLPLGMALVGVLGTGVAGFFSYRASAGIDVVHKSVNSRMDELLDISKKNSRAEGVIEGRASKGQP